MQQIRQNKINVSLPEDHKLAVVKNTKQNTTEDYNQNIRLPRRIFQEHAYQQ